MPRSFYEDRMPARMHKAGLGRFVCTRATWRDWEVAGAPTPGSHFFLAIWHGENTHNVYNSRQMELLQGLCQCLREECDASADCLGCVLAGDFNIELIAQHYSGFERLDPDESVRAGGMRQNPGWDQKQVRDWAGRRRYGNPPGRPQYDVDHVLFYRPPLSPLAARRPRRFRMYDRAHARVLPFGSGVMTHTRFGALDHDPLLVEMWLAEW